jgi:hypothetical protein
MGAIQLWINNCNTPKRYTELKIFYSFLVKHAGRMPTFGRKNLNEHILVFHRVPEGDKKKKTKLPAKKQTKLSESDSELGE